jgi:hypothetical protein
MGTKCIKMRSTEKPNKFIKIKLKKDRCYRMIQPKIGEFTTDVTKWKNNGLVFIDRIDRTNKTSCALIHYTASDGEKGHTLSWNSNFMEM